MGLKQWDYVWIRFLYQFKICIHSIFQKMPPFGTAKSKGFLIVSWEDPSVIFILGSLLNKWLRPEHILYIHWLRSIWKSLHYILSLHFKPNCGRSFQRRLHILWMRLLGFRKLQISPDRAHQIQASKPSMFINVVWAPLLICLSRWSCLVGGYGALLLL